MSVAEELPIVEPSTVEDGVFFDAAHGKVMLRIGGEVWWLRRPTFGEFRKASEAVEAISTPPPKKAGQSGDPVLAIYASAPKPRFAWWRQIVETLSDRPLPTAEGDGTDPDDLLPYWLAAADLVNDTMGHWPSVPPAAPGA